LREKAHRSRGGAKSESSYLKLRTPDTDLRKKRERGKFSLYQQKKRKHRVRKNRQRSGRDNRSGFELPNNQCRETRRGKSAGIELLEGALGDPEIPREKLGVSASKKKRRRNSSVKLLRHNCPAERGRESGGTRWSGRWSKGGRLRVKTVRKTEGERFRRGIRPIDEKGREVYVYHPHSKGKLD